MVDQHLAQHPDQRTPNDMLELLDNFANQVSNLRNVYRNRPEPPSFLERLGQNRDLMGFGMWVLLAGCMTATWFLLPFHTFDFGNFLLLLALGIAEEMPIIGLFWVLGSIIEDCCIPIISAWDDRRMSLDRYNLINYDQIRSAVSNVRAALMALTEVDAHGIRRINCGDDLEQRVIALINNSGNATVHQLEQLALELKKVYSERRQRQQQQQQQHEIHLGDGVVQAQQAANAPAQAYRPNPEVQNLVQGVIDVMHADVVIPIEEPHGANAEVKVEEQPGENAEAKVEEQPGENAEAKVEEQPGENAEPGVNCEGVAYQPLFYSMSSPSRSFNEVEGKSNEASKDSKQEQKDPNECDLHQPLLNKKQSMMRS